MPTYALIDFGTYDSNFCIAFEKFNDFFLADVAAANDDTSAIFNINKCRIVRRH